MEERECTFLFCFQGWRFPLCATYPGVGFPSPPRFSCPIGDDLFRDLWFVGPPLTGVLGSELVSLGSGSVPGLDFLSEPSVRFHQSRRFHHRKCAPAQFSRSTIQGLAIRVVLGSAVLLRVKAKVAQFFAHGQARYARPTGGSRLVAVRSEERRV